MIDEDQKPCILLIFTSIVIIDYLQAEMVYLKFGIIFFPLIYASVWRTVTRAQKLLLRQQKNHIHCISKPLFPHALSQFSP